MSDPVYAFENLDLVDADQSHRRQRDHRRIPSNDASDRPLLQPPNPAVTDSQFIYYPPYPSQNVAYYHPPHPSSFYGTYGYPYPTQQQQQHVQNYPPPENYPPYPPALYAPPYLQYQRPAIPQAASAEQQPGNRMHPLKEGELEQIYREESALLQSQTGDLYGSMSLEPANLRPQKKPLPRSGQQRKQPPNHTRTFSGSEFPAQPTHRRVSSDIPPLAHRRSKSDVLSNLPPIGNRPRSGTSTPRRSSFSPPGSARQRSFSASSIGRSGGSFAPSIMTESSMVSVRMDIRRSSLFERVTPSGKIIFHYPFERVRLSTEKSLPNQLYKVEVDESTYEEYHRVAEEIEQGVWGGSVFDDGFGCTCDCAHCNACTGKENLLPPLNYVQKVDHDIYRRMLDEIITSKRMPLKIFFCGHHEDVDHPSIFIAVTIVTSLLIAMGVVAYLTQS